MMQTHTALKFTLAAALAGLALARPASADIKLNDNLTLSGYIAGAYTYFTPKPGASQDSLFDAAKAPPGAGDANAADLTFTANYQPVTAVVSLFDFPSSASNAIGLTILDAYVRYDAGGGLAITGGRFLSWMGYTSFHPVHMDQISYANGDFLHALPAYHDGVKFDYTTQGGTSTGLAVLDSVYSPYGYNRGDGELQRNAGFEGYVKQQTGDLTLWGGFAYDTKGGFEPHSVLTLDFWGSYQLDKNATLAAEYLNKDGGPGNKGYNWLAVLDYTFTSKVSSAFRISGEKMSDGGPGFTKYTVCPGYALTDHLLVRVEYSYYNYQDYARNSANFFGAQAIFKF